MGRSTQRTNAVAAAVAPGQRLDFERKGRQIGVPHQGVEAEAQRFGIHSGERADLDAHRQNVRAPPRGLRLHGFQHRGGYAHFVHG